MVNEESGKIWLYQEIFDRYKNITEGKNSGIFRSGKNVLLTDDYSILSLPINKVQNKDALGLEKYTSIPVWKDDLYDFFDNDNYRFLSNVKTEDLRDLLVRHEVSFSCKNIWEKDCPLNEEGEFVRISGKEKYSLVGEKQKIENEEVIKISQGLINVNYFHLSNKKTFTLIEQLFDKIEIYIPKADKDYESYKKAPFKGGGWFKEELREKNRIPKFIKFVHNLDDGDKVELVSTPIIDYHILK